MLRVLRQLLVNRPDGKRRHRQSEECHLEAETDRTPGELKHLPLPHCVRLTPLLYDQPVALLIAQIETRHSGSSDFSRQFLRHKSLALFVAEAEFHHYSGSLVGQIQRSARALAAGP